MNVSVAEFKAEIDHYLKLAGEKEIVISLGGRNIARLAPPPRDKLGLLESLCGIVPPTVDEKAIRNERLARHEARA